MLLSVLGDHFEQSNVPLQRPIGVTFGTLLEGLQADARDLFNILKSLQGRRRIKLLLLENRIKGLSRSLEQMKQICHTLLNLYQLGSLSAVL